MGGPFALGHAFNLAQLGDTIYFRGGMTSLFFFFLFFISSFLHVFIFGI